MNSDNNYEVIYCEDNGEYRVYCEISDFFVLSDFIKNIWNQEHTQITIVKDNNWSKWFQIILYN